MALFIYSERRGTMIDWSKPVEYLPYVYQQVEHTVEVVDYHVRVKRTESLHHMVKVRSLDPERYADVYVKCTSDGKIINGDLMFQNIKKKRHVLMVVTQKDGEFPRTHFMGTEDDADAIVAEKGTQLVRRWIEVEE
jgi:hypothetical protein